MKFIIAIIKPFKLDEVREALSAIGVAGMATISASNQEKMHKGFAPLLPGFKYVEFDDLEGVKAAMGAHTAGFLVEPIQGEGGIRTGSDEFLRGLRQLADENDLMLVFDEVQCGVARSGTMFFYEQLGIEPDIMTGVLRRLL